MAICRRSKTRILSKCMSRKRPTITKAAGSSPGTLIYIGEQRSEPVTISIIEYNESRIEELKVDSPQKCKKFVESDAIDWIDVDGLHDASVIQAVGETFNLHPLVLEDILNTQQRPKVDDYEHYIFFIVKMIIFDKEKGQIVPEHVAMVLGKRFVLTCQEVGGDVFDPVRNRLRTAKGRIRKMGADYLAYALIDAVVDTYFSILEEIGDQIEEIEQRLLHNPGQATVQEIHLLKRELVYLRRAVWPLRESVSALLRDESELISDATKIYLRDLYDHVIQVIDTVEVLRDVVSGMLEMYLSSISNKMNEVMKVLTVMSTIFIPLNFMAGLYGMNFEYMPELKSPWGYPIVLGAMATVAISLILFFRRRRWI